MSGALVHMLIVDTGVLERPLTFLTVMGQRLFHFIDVPSLALTYQWCVRLGVLRVVMVVNLSCF